LECSSPVRDDPRHDEKGVVGESEGPVQLLVTGQRGGCPTPEGARGVAGVEQQTDLAIARPQTALEPITRILLAVSSVVAKVIGRYS
jgi:hypothetical protein